MNEYKERYPEGKEEKIREEMSSLSEETLIWIVEDWTRDANSTTALEFVGRAAKEGLNTPLTSLMNSYEDYTALIDDLLELGKQEALRQLRENDLSLTLKI